MKNDIQNFVRRCRSCQEQKLVRIKMRQPMIITDASVDAFDKVAIDLIGPLPTTPDGNRYVLTMQNNLIKYCMAEPISDKRASTVADVSFDNLSVASDVRVLFSRIEAVNSLVICFIN